MFTNCDEKHQAQMPTGSQRNPGRPNQPARYLQPTSQPPSFALYQMEGNQPQYMTNFYNQQQQHGTFEGYFTHGLPPPPSQHLHQNTEQTLPPDQAQYPANPYYPQLQQHDFFPQYYTAPTATSHPTISHTTTIHAPPLSLQQSMERGIDQLQLSLQLGMQQGIQQLQQSLHLAYDIGTTMSQLGTLTEALKPLEAVFAKFAATKKLDLPQLRIELLNYFLVRRRNAQTWTNWSEAVVDQAIIVAAHNAGLNVEPQYPAARFPVKWKRCSEIFFHYEEFALDCLQKAWKSGRRQVLPPWDMPPLNDCFTRLSPSRSRPTSPFGTTTGPTFAASQKIMVQGANTGNGGDEKVVQIEASSKTLSSTAVHLREAKVRVDALPKSRQERINTTSTSEASPYDKSGGFINVLMVTEDGKSAIVEENKETVDMELGMVELAGIQSYQYRGIVKDSMLRSRFPKLDHIIYLAIHISDKGEKCRYFAMEFKRNQENKWIKIGDYIRSDDWMMMVATTAATSTATSP